MLFYDCFDTEPFKDFMGSFLEVGDCVLTAFDCRLILLLDDLLLLFLELSLLMDLDEAIILGDRFLVLLFDFFFFYP